MMVMIDICGSFYLGKKNSSNADIKELKWLFPFTLIGIVVGGLVLLQAPSAPLLIILGVFATFNGARVLWQRNSELHKVINKWWAAPFGFLGGIFTALLLNSAKNNVIDPLVEKVAPIDSLLKRSDAEILEDIKDDGELNGSNIKTPQGQKKQSNPFGMNGTQYGNQFGGYGKNEIKWKLFIKEGLYIISFLKKESSN